MVSDPLMNFGSPFLRVSRTRLSLGFKLINGIGLFSQGPYYLSCKGSSFWLWMFIYAHCTLNMMNFSGTLAIFGPATVHIFVWTMKWNARTTNKSMLNELHVEIAQKSYIMKTFHKKLDIRKIRSKWNYKYIIYSWPSSSY